MKKNWVIILILCCTSFIHNISKVNAQVTNEWKADIKDVKIYWQWKDAKLQLLPDVGSSGIGNGTIGNQAVADKCPPSIDNPPPGDKDKLKTQIKNCFACCGVFTQSDSTEKFYTQKVDPINNARRVVLFNYCTCECAIKAQSKIAGVVCGKPKEKIDVPLNTSDEYINYRWFVPVVQTVIDQANDINFSISYPQPTSTPIPVPPPL